MRPSIALFAGGLSLLLSSVLTTVGCGTRAVPLDPGDSSLPTAGGLGGSGGVLPRLYFTVVGDTRPATLDDTPGYPTAVIDAIYGDIAAMSPPPPFTLSTGDYMFASPSGGQAGPQLDLYMAARARFPGVFFPAMGNHECTGATASNCGPGNADGITDNMGQFLTKLIGPLGKAAPYYSIDLGASDGSWTCKLVFIAANAWDAGQASWLEAVMSRETTYTFVVRHEPTGTTAAPGVDPSARILERFPYTLLITGHTHTCARRGAREVVFGNGGAPLTGSGNYGYGVLVQRDDGAIQVDVVDYQSGQPDPAFRFAVTPSGAPAP